MDKSMKNNSKFQFKITVFLEKIENETDIEDI